MDISDIRYTPRVKLSGKTGFDHMFDFAIPKVYENDSARVRAWRARQRNGVPGRPGRPRIHESDQARKAAWRARERKSKPDEPTPTET